MPELNSDPQFCVRRSFFTLWVAVPSDAAAAVGGLNEQRNNHSNRKSVLDENALEGAWAEGSSPDGAVSSNSKQPTWARGVDLDARIEDWIDTVQNGKQS